MTTRNYVDKEKVKKLHEQGLSNGEISERLGCSKQAVVNILSQFGLTKTPKARTPT